MADESTEDQGTAQSKPSSLPMNDIEYPGIDDVMFGRGGDTNYHIGNHRFRVLADMYRREYRSASRKEKALVVKEVVRCWRVGGRFLTRTDPTKGEKSPWHDVGNGIARKKAAKILSEKAPEEKMPNGEGNGKRAKTPAAESMDEGRAVRQRAERQPAPGPQPSCDRQAASTSLCATSTPTSMVASLLPRSAPAPAHLPCRMPVSSLAHPLLTMQESRLPVFSLAQPLLTMEESRQLSVAGALPHNLSARDMISLYRNNGLSLAPLSASGLAMFDTGISRVALVARRRIEETSRERFLANALLMDNLRLARGRQSLPPATPANMLTWEQLQLIREYQRYDESNNGCIGNKSWDTT